MFLDTIFPPLSSSSFLSRRPIKGNGNGLESWKWVEKSQERKRERNKDERILTRNLSSAETFIFYQKLLDLKDFYLPRFEEEEMKEMRGEEMKEEKKWREKERWMKKPLDKMQMEGSRKNKDSEEEPECLDQKRIERERRERSASDFLPLFSPSKKKEKRVNLMSLFSPHFPLSSFLSLSFSFFLNPSLIPGNERQKEWKNLGWNQTRNEREKKKERKKRKRREGRIITMERAK